MPPRVSGGPKFAIENYVRVKDNHAWHLSKIVNHAEHGGQRWYFVHFLGWARKWDRWETEENVKVYDEKDDSVQVLNGNTLMGGKDKGKANTGATKATKASDIDGKIMKNGDSSTEGVNNLSSMSRRSDSTTAGGDNKKRSAAEIDAVKEGEDPKEIQAKRIKYLVELRDNDLEDDEEDVGRPSLNLRMPLTLKKHMLDEWELITTKREGDARLLKLPRPLSVAQILKDFVQSKQAKADTEQFQLYADLFDGLQLYFDRSCPRVLLYRQEREQWNDIVAKVGQDVSPSHVYGPEHLIRLFSKLPGLLSQTSMTVQALQPVLNKLTEAVKYVNKFCVDRLEPGDYLRNAEAFSHQAETLGGLSEEALSALRQL